MIKTALSAALAAALLLAGCASGGSGSDYQTCKAGVEQAVAAGNGNASPPPVCSHLSQAQIYKITQQVMNDHERQAMQDTAPPATPAQEQRCTLQIEAQVNAGTLPEIRGIRPHDPRLPGQCRPLGLYQLQAAVHQALTDLGG
jgi:hypothetical protein